MNESERIKHLAGINEAKDDGKTYNISALKKEMAKMAEDLGDLNWRLEKAIDYHGDNGSAKTQSIANLINKTLAAIYKVKDIK